jgi:flavin reductase (DIM6/NTAB) family NADH-FMN oxidoreductase RutF
MSRQFAQVGIDRFAGVAWHERNAGPALDDAVAWIECTIDAVHEAGDHWIVVGAVDRLEVRDADTDPLVFFRGRYGSFAEEGPEEPEGAE